MKVNTNFYFRQEEKKKKKGDKLVTIISNCYPIKEVKVKRWQT